MSMVDQVHKLNGSIGEKRSTCSHFVCASPNRPCIASGKWILCTEYIEKSTQAGYFLDVS